MLDCSSASSSSLLILDDSSGRVILGYTSGRVILGDSSGSVETPVIAALQILALCTHT